MFTNVKCNIWWTLKDENNRPVGPHPPHNVEVRWVDDEGFHVENVYAYPGYNIYGHRPYQLINFGNPIPSEVASEVKRQINNHNTRANSRLVAAFRERRGTKRLPVVAEAS